MLSDTILYNIRILYSILYYTLLYCIILCYFALYYTILYTILYYIILLYCTILYYTIVYYTTVYYTVLYYNQVDPAGCWTQPGGWRAGALQVAGRSEARPRPASGESRGQRLREDYENYFPQWYAPSISWFQKGSLGVTTTRANS